ncbi:hypothetical protein BDP27DRAFT_1382371 [Rhodocollybia butyracea]|uniref:Uncharacterized protein n=1 Tax=Rhodocollybia butyracea TaxID=206335 RepID=A0A9P5Q099_9AGAR|nr:hypothetical protein BDP27DRAFT_1382371 [Rhodocollybia butyracea]
MCASSISSSFSGPGLFFLHNVKKSIWYPQVLDLDRNRNSDQLGHVDFIPSFFERTSYYNGITGDDQHPLLLYRSDYGTTPYNKPTGRFASLPVKSIHGVFDTPLNKDNVWIPLGLKIVQIIKARKVSLTSVDPARFYTHPAGEGRKRSLSPVVIWIGVKPNTTSSETAHEVSLDILDLLKDEGIEGEWRESVLQKLAGHPLLPAVSKFDATYHVRRFLTPFHGVSLATEDREREDTHGTLTIGGAPRSYVRICGGHRFDRALDEITDEIAVRVDAAEGLTRWLASKSADNNAEEIKDRQIDLDRETKAVNDLLALYRDATTNWSHIGLHRNIGYTQFAPAITVDKGGSRFTSDWGVFVAAEAKVKDAFEGNVVHIGTKYTSQQLRRMFNPIPGPDSFKVTQDGKLRIEGWSTLDQLAVPEDIDNTNQRCVMVAKDGNATDLTIGRYAGLVSFTENDFGVTSIEIGIYNSGPKTAEPFSEKSALVWHVIKGKAFIVGQLHSGQNKGGSTTQHVTYCTPGEKLLENIRAKFPHPDFFRTAW